MAEESYEQPVKAEDREEVMEYAAPADPQSAIADALALIVSFGQIGGDHHNAWTIDQVVRKLTGENYQRFIDFHDLSEIEGLNLSDPEAVAKARKIGSGDYYEDDFTDEEIARVEAGYYSWDEGIAP
jgi:hypothetical protein